MHVNVVFSQRREGEASLAHPRTDARLEGRGEACLAFQRDDAYAGRSWERGDLRRTMPSGQAEAVEGTMRWRLGLAAVLATLVLVGFALVVPGPASAQSDDFPIFDTHLHYSQDAWGLFTAQEILALMDQAGVYKALMSSTPDDGTIQLYQLAPDRIVPILRPYRTRADMTTWTRDGTVVSYVEERLARGGYRGLGEFHLGTGESANLAPRRFADLSAELDIYLHAHADAAAVAELAALRSDSKVLWAHAGMGATPGMIDDLLARHPNIWVELALRTDVAPGGRLDPSWAALFAKYPDRFMIGTDTWIPSRWPQLPRLMSDVRIWLRQLPYDLAVRIASGNAEALFGRQS